MKWFISALKMLLRLLVNKNFKTFIKVLVFDFLVVSTGIPVCCFIWSLFICFSGQSQNNEEKNMQEQRNACILVENFKLHGWLLNLPWKSYYFQRFNSHVKMLCSLNSAYILGTFKPRSNLYFKYFDFYSRFILYDIDLP